MKRKLFVASTFLLLLSAACHAVLGLSDPVVERLDVSEDGAAPADVTGDVSSGEDASPDVDPEGGLVPPNIDAGCWADVVVVQNGWPDFSSTPVPQPRLATGVSNRASYDASVPGEVYDNITKLTWLVEPDGGAPPTATQQGATEQCAARGARLPTRMELVTIQNWYPSDEATAGADPEFFPDTSPTSYWSATPVSSNINFGWAVGFASIGFGLYPNINKTAVYPFRCVKGPTPVPTAPSHRYEVSLACGIVRDTGTRLEWERGRGKSGRYTQGEAHCETMPLEGRNAWRIPTYSELASLLYTARENPAIDILVFESEQGLYWTSTLPNRFPNNRIVMPFSDGMTTEVRNDAVADVWARCVRTMDD